jgi:integrase
VTGPFAAPTPRTRLTPAAQARRHARNVGPAAQATAIHPEYAFDTTTGPLASIFTAIADWVEEGVPDNTKLKDDLAWARWCEYCAILKTAPWRMDRPAHSGGDPAGFERESQLLCGFLIWCHSIIKPRSKTDAAAKPESSYAMVHAVRRTHRSKNVVMVSCKQLGLIFKGLTARHIAEHGADSLLPHRKEPIDPPLLRRLLQVASVDSRKVDWASPLFISLAAAFALAGAAGFRKAEVALPSSTTLDDHRLRRSSLLWRIDGTIVADPAPELLRAMVSGRDMAIVKPPCAKNDPDGTTFGAHPIYLRYSSVDPANAAARLRTLELALPCRGAERRAHALFVVDANLKAMSHAVIDEHLARLLRALMSNKEASRFTFHSFRIGFACALLEAGCSYDMIQALARWKSNQSIVIYARLEPHAYADWVDKAMLQSTSSTTARDLPTINDDVRVASFAQAAAHFEREGAATIEDT